MKKVIALGFFDSIHLGHQSLLKKGKSLSEEKNIDFYVSTFDDNFGKFMKKNECEIFTLNEKKSFLKTLGYDNLIVFPTDNNFFSKTKQQFCDYLLNFEPEILITGEDYRFGKNAEGQVSDLRDYFGSRHVQVETYPLLKKNGEKISTGDIVKFLKIGDIKAANILLGRNFSYSGDVKHGREDGEKIGFQTVNLEIPPQKIKIKSGVYVTNTLFNQKKYLSVTNVGTHPTLDDLHFNVETHIIDFKEKIYGENITVEFIERLRDIVKFNDIKSLSQQIYNDVLKAKEKYL